MDVIELSWLFALLFCNDLCESHRVVDLDCGLCTTETPVVASQVVLRPSGHLTHQIHASASEMAVMTSGE